MNRTYPLFGALTLVMSLAACGSNPAAPSSAAPPAASIRPAPSAATPTLPPATEAAATQDPLDARTLAEIQVSGGPDWPVAAFDALWVVTPDGDLPTVTRIDAATESVSATIDGAADVCQALGATTDAVWVCSAQGVSRIDPETDEVVATVEFDVGAYFGYLPFGAGSLWALGGQAAMRNAVVRIDPTANEVIETIPLEFDASWISYGANALWITDTSGGQLWRLDPDSGNLTVHTTDLPGPGPSAIGAGAIWLTLRSGPDDRPIATDVTLVRISPESGDIESEIVLGGTLGEAAIHADDDSVWVRSVDPFLTHVDPASDEIVESFHAQALGGSVTVGFGSVWATSYRLDTVWRIAP